MSLLEKLQNHSNNYYRWLVSPSGIALAVFAILIGVLSSSTSSKLGDLSVVLLCVACVIFIFGKYAQNKNNRIYFRIGAYAICVIALITALIFLLAYFLTD